MFTNWLTNSTPNSGSLAQLPPPTMATTPPDVVLEVGPSPSVRFVAHSIVLSMHSGYLRSAIRLDENGNGNSSEIVLFLINVTAEQFAPLLTYMYTGYLDLNVDNIFGVLLATHVLHMPRALEICRAFLSRAQSEGFLSNGPFLGVNSNNKIIRPIASKASVPNLGFIAPPMQHVSLPSTGTPFKSLQHQFPPGPVVPSAADELSESDTQSISVSSPKPTPNPSERATSPKHASPPASTTQISTPKRHNKSKRSTDKSRNKLILPTPLTTSTTTTSTCTSTGKDATPPTEGENKTIIDVASCDGPIRFRRVLNDAYGHKPDVLQFAPAPERTQQSVSFSFHQQMAKTISQRQMQSEESENSEDLSRKTSGACSNSKSGEIYNCVYCKHTFKSQYCYQKHAKRHLNPLSLDCSTNSNKSSSSVSSGTTPPTTATATTTAIGSAASGSGDIEKDDKNCASADLQRREVRPLDMNVQYYPCKMCGSKFPSYYFVHKHRKMCHANEENVQADAATKSDHH